MLIFKSIYRFSVTGNSAESYFFENYVKECLIPISSSFTIQSERQVTQIAQMVSHVHLILGSKDLPNPPNRPQIISEHLGIHFELSTRQAKVQFFIWINFNNLFRHINIHREPFENVVEKPRNHGFQQHPLGKTPFRR